jgi:hypothetical protein
LNDSRIENCWHVIYGFSKLLKLKADEVLAKDSRCNSSASHIFIEEDEKGRWRVAWRIVRHTGHIKDLPTYYGVEWVRPAGWNEPGLPLRSGEKPDPKKHELEFRDKCGEVDTSL